jgi:hypothetical protein
MTAAFVPRAQDAAFASGAAAAERAAMGNATADAVARNAMRTAFFVLNSLDFLVGLTLLRYWRATPHGSPPQCILDRP